MALVLTACTGPGASPTPDEAPTEGDGGREPAAAVQAQKPPQTTTPEPAWVAERVAASEQRLAAQGEAGQMIAESIRTHGGLERWFSNGPLAFRFRYAPVGDRPARDTYQVIDTWSSRARHHVHGAPDEEFGWDGQVAWQTYDAEAIKPRFWALTPYYFVGIPFVLADEGVILERAGEQTFEGQRYDLVKASFAEGTGDAPDDYYIVYLEPQSRRVAGVRYIVSYPGFFPEGGHSPEKLMKYDGAQTVGGIVFAETFRTFKWDPQTEQVGELVTNSEMSKVSFEPDTPSSFFAPPEGATVLEGM